MAKRGNGKDIVRVCAAINEAYQMEDYDGYEALIEHGGKAIRNRLQHDG